MPEKTFTIARCSACKQRKRLRKQDGMIGMHNRSGSSWGSRCPGAGKPPLQEEGQSND